MTKAKSVIDGYKLRLIAGIWYVRLYADGGATHVKDLGGFDYKTAVSEGEKLGVPDLDRLAGVGDRP